MVLDALLDACVDSLKLLPFLFLTYLFMEWLEHGAGERFESIVAKAGPLGPVIGSILGVVPQCGFSGAAATLYAGRVVTLGTLCSVFLVTSDEMLPVMISQAAPLSLIVKILAIKLVAGMVTGIILDVVLRSMGRSHQGFGGHHSHDGHEGHDIHKLCEQEGCDCARDCGCDSCASRTDCVCEHALAHSHEHHHDHGHEHHHGHHGGWGHLAGAALRHSLQITVFVLVITFLLNLVAGAGMEAALTASLEDSPLSVAVAGILGFIPNCAVSVALTQLYLDGVLGGAALMAGLLTNAGIGLLVLVRTNNDFRENVRIMALLLAVALVVAFATGSLGLL